MNNNYRACESALLLLSVMDLLATLVVLHVANAFVPAGAKLNAVEQDQMTPLHLAATQGQKATVIALLNLGADPDAEGKEKWPPLLWAAHKGNTEVVEVLCTAHGQTKRHMQQVRYATMYFRASHRGQRGI